jgi:hypothetical protein
LGELDALPAKKQRGRGLPAFKTVDFQTEHSLQGMAQQACLKLHAVAIIVPKTSTYPGPRPATLTPAWKQMARNFAAHMLTVYRPWGSEHNLPQSVTWKGYCDWVEQLKASDSVMCRTQPAFVTLASNNLHFNLMASRLMRHHRAKRATIWHKVASAPEDRPRAFFLVMKSTRIRTFPLMYAEADRAGHEGPHAQNLYKIFR